MKYDRLTDNLNLISNEHMSRYAMVHKAVMFPETDTDQDNIYHNIALREFVENERVIRSLTDTDALMRLSEISAALTQTSKNILHQKKSEALSVVDYTEFQNLSNEFVSRLRRFEYELSREESGIDTLTGLRSHIVMSYDLVRELSSCERRGDYLGIIMGKIDNFEHLKKKLSKQNIFDIIIFVSDVIKKNMRLYDDGYRYKENTFVITLKHTDQPGAVSATERFARMLRDAHDTPIGRQIESLAQQEITLSFSISKLEVGADMRDILDNLEVDINENADNTSTILEYNDISPIERFAKGIDH